MIKYKYSKLYWFLKSFEWMKIYFSPFKPPIPKVYIGKVAVGTPYFFPRVFKKATPKKAAEEALEEIKRVKEHNEKEQTYKRTVRTFDDLYKQKLNSSFAQPKKVGFDFVELGWKTKWERDDYRFEHSPVWSFIFFKWQIAITFVAVDAYRFWECWLFYSRETKGTTEERLNQARKEFPCIWTSHSSEGKITTNYWNVILKEKWKNN